MRFNIEVEEIFQDVYEVEAETLKEAIDIVRGKFDRGEIILDSENFMERNFKEYKCIEEYNGIFAKCSHCGKDLKDGVSRMITSLGTYCYGDECQKAYSAKREEREG